MPFLGKVPSQIVDSDVDIDGGTIDGATIGSITAGAGTFTNLSATGTITFPDDGISGDDINGGTISNFTSTGIDDNATSTAITIDSSQNVGIGTASPSSKLSVNSGADNTALALESSDAACWLTMTDPSGTVFFGNTGGNYALYTAGTERLRIDSSGNVGIGTSSPIAKTHITKTAGTALVITSEATNANTQSGYIDFQGSSNGTGQGARISAPYESTYGRTGLAFYTSNTASDTFTPAERMRIDSSGNLLVGTTSASGNLTAKGLADDDVVLFVSPRVLGTGLAASETTAKIQSQKATCLDLNRFYSHGTILQFRHNNDDVGSISVTGSTTAYNTSSDYRLKENLVGLDNGIDRLKQIPVYRFNFIVDPDTTVDGFIAHEVQDVVPEAISGTKDGMATEEYEVSPAVLDEEGNVVTEAVMGTREVPEYQGIDQSKLVPLLTAALQEAVAKIEDLESRLSALETN